MDHLKEGIGLRAYGQKDPLLEYKKEGFQLFSEMMASIKEQIIPVLMRIQTLHQDTRRDDASDQRLRQLQESRPDFQIPSASDPAEDGMTGQPNQGGPVQTVKRLVPKVGRNEPCPCGSGKKYKKCHGA